MKKVFTIVGRDLRLLFSGMSTWLFFIAYTMSSGYLMMENGAFFNRSSADLQSFFMYQPLLLIVLISALTMRSFSDEYKSGTMELLSSLPFSTTELVLGKYLAVTVTAFVAIVLTFPAWVTVNRLGVPDNGVIFSGYLFLWLTACAYASVGIFFSAGTMYQTTAFICSVFVNALTTFSAHIGENFLTGKTEEILSIFSFKVRFERICAGIMNADDILYYVSFIGIWLFSASILLILKKTNLARWARLNMLAGFVLFVVFNLSVSPMLSVYGIDLTKDKIYTMAPVTEKALKNIPETLTVTVYQSKNLTGDYADYALYVRRFLQRMIHLSGGSFKGEFKKVDAYSVAEDEALFEGLDDVGRQSTMTVLGLKIQAPYGRKRVLTALHPDDKKFLEYRLTKAVEDLSARQKPLLGIISTRPELAGWPIVERLRSLFDVRFISRNTLVLPKVDALMLLDPQRLNESVLYVVDQYLMNGGKVAVFADVYSTDEDLKAFQRFLNPWGLSVKSNMTDNENVDISISSVVLTRKNFSQENPVFYAVKNIFLPRTGSLETKDEKDVTVYPLLTLKTEKEGKTKPFVFAVHAKGFPVSAFDNIPSTNVFFVRKNDGFKKAKREAKMFLTADSSMLQKPENALFIANILETLTKTSADVPIKETSQWRRSFKENKTLQEKVLERQRDSAKTVMDVSQNVLARMKAKTKDISADFYAQKEAEKSLKVFEKRLLSFRADFRKASERLKETDQCKKQALFLINVFFVPSLLTGFVLLIFLLRSRRGRKK